MAHTQAANTSSLVSFHCMVGSEWPGQPSQWRVGEVDGRDQLVEAWSSVGCTFVVQQATLCEAVLWADVMLKGERRKSFEKKRNEVDKQSRRETLLSSIFITVWNMSY